MNILWITNIILPPASQKLRLYVHTGGGWMLALANALKALPDVRLAIATVYSGTELQCFDCDGVTYYLLPGKNQSATYYNKCWEPLWQQVKLAFNPDVIHIHGTEFPYGLSFLNACGTENVVVSIQGLLCSCSHYYHFGMSKWDVIKNITPMDIYAHNSILAGKRSFQKRAVYELQALQKTHHIIGRTSWDRSKTWSINPDAKYHFCNETLRESFYNKKWNYDDCQKHSIFLSQAGYPIKGVHMLIKALPIVLKKYPNTIIRIAGNNIFITEKKPMASWRDKGYAKYLKQLSKKLCVTNHIVFIGPKDDNAMAQELLAANIFISPSTIENSSNSLGEAQLIGTPCIASYVGGTSDLIEDGKTGLLYRFEEISQLAYYICYLFENQDFCKTLSENERLVANERHNPQKNAATMLNIYNDVVKLR